MYVYGLPVIAFFGPLGLVNDMPDGSDGFAAWVVEGGDKEHER